MEHPTKEAQPAEAVASIAQWFRIGLAAMVGAGGGYCFIKLIPDRVGMQLKSTPWLFWSIVLGLPFYYFVVVLVHELGHAFAGWCVGFRFNSLIVGPIKLEKLRGEGGIRWRLNRSVNLAGGLTLSLPEDSNRLTQRFIIYIAGGPIASILLAAICFGAAGLMRESPWSVVIGWVGFLSLMIFFVTSIPFRAQGFATDGRRILTLLDRSRSAVELSMLTAIAHLQSGRRPRELPVDLIRQAIDSNPPRNMQFLALHSYCYYHACDAGEREKARHHLAKIVENVNCYPPGLRNSLWLTPATDAAIYDQDLMGAKAYRERYHASVFCQAADLHRYNAAVAVLEGEIEVARHEINRTRETLCELMSPGFEPMYQGQLEELERRIADTAGANPNGAANAQQNSARR